MTGAFPLGSRVYWLLNACGDVVPGYSDGEKPERVEWRQAVLHGGKQMSGKILIGEHNPRSLHHLDRMLRASGWNTMLARHGMEAWRMLLQADPPEIALIDWDLPRLDGFRLCTMMKERAEKSGAYLILMAEDANEERAAAGLLAGADGLLYKPVNPRELHAHLLSARRRLAYISRTLQQQESAELVSNRDDLTGLLNRSGIFHRMERQMQRAARYMESTALVLIWIDDLDLARKLWEQDIVDRMLNRAARWLELSVRSYDSIGRTSEDQFLAVLPDCSQEQAVILAARLQKVLARHCGGMFEEGLAFTASAGVSAAGPRAVLSPKELFYRVERSLLRAGSCSRRSTAVIDLSAEPLFAAVNQPAAPG